MGRIKVRGKLNDETIVADCTIVNDELSILFNGKRDKYLQGHFEIVSSIAPLMAGTYRPPRNSLLSAFNVFSTVFFDGEPKFLVAENIGEMPFEPNTIY